MARKPGPKDGARVAPEQRAESLPADRADALTDGSEQFLPTGREPDPLPGDATRPDADLSGTSRAETLSDEGLGSSGPDAPLATTTETPFATGTDVPLGSATETPLGTTMDVPVPETSSPDRGAVPEDWRSAVAAEPTGRDQDPPGSGPVVWNSEPATPVAGASEDAGRAGSPEEPFSARVPDPVPPLSAPPPRRSGLGGLLLGGLIAAALGFGAAWLAQDRFGLPGTRLPVDLEARLAALEAGSAPGDEAVGELADRLAQAETRLSALEEAPTETSPAADLEPLRAELTQGIEAAQARASELEERLAALETRPNAPTDAPTSAPTGTAAPLGSLATEGVGPATGGADAEGTEPAVSPTPAPAPAPAVDPEALREDVLAGIEPRLSGTETSLSEVQAALTELDARLDAAEAASAAATEQARAASETTAQIEARAAAAEAEARSRAALASLDGALESGEPFDAALAELEASGAEVSEALATRATEGVPTLAALRETFPETARAGLAAARDEGLVQDGSGVLGFLSGQLSLRSTTPRQGDDPDAVLSRVGGSLEQGNVAEAVTLAETLPEPVRAAMGDWIAQARARADAEAALAGLRDALPAPQTPNETTAAD